MIISTDYLCPECKYREQVSFLKSEHPTITSMPERMKCPNCDDEMEKLFCCGEFIIREENNIGDSTKPSSYWSNAEKLRLKTFRKNQEEKVEKEYYEKMKELGKNRG